MNKEFDRIFDRLEERKKYFEAFNKKGRRKTDDIVKNATDIFYDEFVKIVQEVAEEYNDGWIACSDRLPEESLNSVIGWDEYRQRCCFVQYYGGRWILGNDIDSVKIIAWKPLPEPFKERD